MTTTLEAALDYVGRGWSVLPLYGVAEDGACRCRDGQLCPAKNRGKHPRGTKHGWRPQTKADEVSQWYAANPHDNLGIVTGPESGVFVFDVDGAAGVQTVSTLATEHGALPATRIVETGSGGLHYFFRHPGHFIVHNSTSWIGPGIDIRGQGGQVVAPPSVSARGPYRVIADNPVAEAPGWLLEALAEHAANVEAGRSTEVVAAAPVDVELIPEKVRNLRAQVMGDGEGRHRHFHALVAACFDAGYPQGQTVTIVAPWCVAVGKFIGRVEQEVARSWGKLEAERAREAEWLGPTGSLGGPVGAPAAAVTQTPAAAPGGVQIEPGEADGTAAPDALAQALASWDPVDLESILDGTYVAPEAELYPRTDGVCLLYRGLVHSFHGESESGKSLIAQAESARVLMQDGGSVAYIDFESDAPSVVGRLLEMGAEADAVRTSFHYRRPGTNPLSDPTEREAFVRMLGVPYDLVVIDGMTDALSVFGTSSNDMDEVTVFMRTFPRMVASRTGAAVVLVDHVSKDSENRGRHAVGSQAKLNALDGAAYVIDIDETLGRGRVGVVTMSCGKDRPGGIRGKLPPSKRRDRLQPAARVVIDGRGGVIDVSVEPPVGAVGEVGGPAVDVPLLTRMQAVSEALADAGEALSKNKVELRVKGDAKLTRKALKKLVDDGYVIIEKGRAGHDVFAHSRDYSADSDLYSGWAEDPTSVTSVDLGATSVNPHADTSVSPVSPPTGDTEVGPTPRRAPTSVDLGAEVTEVESSEGPACKTCFRFLTVDEIKAFGDRCQRCAKNAGLA